MIFYPKGAKRGIQLGIIVRKRRPDRKFENYWQAAKRTFLAFRGKYQAWEVFRISGKEIQCILQLSCAIEIGNLKLYRVIVKNLWKIYSTGAYRMNGSNRMAKRGGHG